MDTLENLEQLNVSEGCFDDIMEDIVSYAYNLYGPRKGERIRRKVRAARSREERMAAHNEMKKNGGDYQGALRKVSDRRSEWNTAAGKELKQTLDSQDVKDTRKEIGKELRKRTREAKKERKENLINSLNNLFNNKKASDEAGRTHSDAQIDKGLSEDLENLNVSEECFEDIISIVETIINEYLTVGNVLDAANKSVGIRRQQYIDAGKTSGITPEDRKRLGDRFERASKVKRVLANSNYKPTRRADSKIRDLIKNATKSEGDRNKEKENSPSYTWNTKYTRPGESGYRIMPILKTDRF